MPELSNSIGTLHEEAALVAGSEDAQILRAEAAVVIGDHSLRGYNETAETSVPLAEAPDAVPETPPEHPDIDPATLTVDGLIKACSHFAAIAASDHALAERMAKRTIEFKQNEAEMRQQGMDHETVRKQQWSSMLKRHKDKASATETPKATKTAEKPAAEQTFRLELETSPVTPPTASIRIATEQRPLQHAIHISGEGKVVDDFVAREVTIPAVPQALSHMASLAFMDEDAVTRAAHDHRLFNEQHDTESSSPNLATGNDGLQSSQEATPETAMDTTPTPVKDVIDLAPLEHPSSDSQDVTAEIPEAEEPPDISYVDASNIENDQRNAPNQQDWGEIAEREPLTVYDYFANALRIAAAANTQEVAAADDEVPAIEPVVLTEAGGEPQTPAILVAINERLADLEIDRKAAYAPLLGDIIEEVQATNALIAEGAEPEAVEDAQLRLEDLTVQLFEQLGVVYEQEDIEHFVSTLLRLDFQPVRLEEPAMADLEKDGTHEAKLHFTQFMGGLSDMEETIERLLGKLVMFHATPNNAADSLSAAA